MMINCGYALGVFVIQMGTSLAYNQLGFSHALEILGGLYLLNAIGFTIHAACSSKAKGKASDPNTSEVKEMYELP